MLNHAPERQVNHRFFFALFPPPLVAHRIAHWAERFGPRGSFVRADRLHLTLDILDDFESVPQEIVEGLMAAGAAVAANPFMIELDLVSGGGASVALRPRLRNSALQRLVDLITAARGVTGVVGRESYRFSPHITLAYRDGRPFSESVTPFAWEVTSFTLVHSLLRQTRHEPLGTWPLTGEVPDQYALL